MPCTGHQRAKSKILPRSIKSWNENLQKGDGQTLGRRMDIALRYCIIYRMQKQISKIVQNC